MTSAKGERFASFGTGLLLLALVAVLTGVALLPFYHATEAAAHGSVLAIQRSPLLRLLRAAHHWTSALLILFGGLTLVYGLFSSAYRCRCRLVWLTAVGLVLLFLLFQLTGHLLPWDQHAVSSAVIEIGVAANVPVVGPSQAQLLRGGDAISGRTLTAWYVAHILLLPAALLVLAGLFLRGLRQAGWPGRLPGAALAGGLVLLLLGAIAVPAPLGPPAGPEDYTSFAARPEWYVLPLHGLLSLAQRIGPGLAFIGTVVIPGLAVAWLLALPWFDRRSTGEPASRGVASLAALGCLGLLLLGLLNVGHMAPLFRPALITSPAAATNSSASSDPPLDPVLIQKGKALFAKHGCGGCHAVKGEGGAVGPPLDGAGKRQPRLEWQVRHLKNPTSVVQGSTMPSYKQLSEAELRALATFVLSLK